MMRRLWLIGLLVASTQLFAARILTVTPSTVQAGQAVTIKYKNAPAGAEIGVYTTTSRVPLKKRMNVQSGMPSAGYKDTIPEGEYIIRCQTDSAVLDSVKLVVLPAAWEGETRIGLLADIHVMAPELLIAEGSAYTKDVMQNRKMLHLSHAVWEALVDSMIAEQPDYLLIAGDLTKDGEYVSHERVVSGLQRLDSAGIQTFVIPGNHDIDNTAAYAYNGSKRETVISCSEIDFRELYAPYGYDTTCFEVDSMSLSYVAQLTDSLMLIGIDTYDGTLDTRTLRWITDHADTIAAHHLHAIAMMHHQAVNHFSEQNVYVSASQVENNDSVAYVLATHGVHLLMTGHLHISDITKDYPGLLLVDSLCEIATGSPIVFPCHYRLLSYTDSTSTLKVQTRLLRAVDTIADLQTYACRWSEDKMQTIIPTLTERLWQRLEPVLSTLGSTRMFKRFYELLPKTKAERTQMVNTYLERPLTDTYLTHCEAAEDRFFTDDLKSSIYAGVDSMTQSILDKGDFSSWQQTILLTGVRGAVRAAVGAPLTSILTDESNYLTLRSVHVPDHVFLFELPEIVPPKIVVPDTTHIDPQVPDTTIQDALDYQAPMEYNGTCYDMLGRPVTQPVQGGVYILGNKKILK